MNLSAVGSWFIRHWFDFVVVGISIVVSLFPVEIKAYFRARGRNMSVRTARMLGAELEELQRLHKSAYELLLYLTWNFIHAAFWTINLSIVVTIVGVLSSEQPKLSWYEIIAAINFGQGLIHVNKVVKQLCNYERNVERLEGAIKIYESTTDNRAEKGATA